MGYEKFLGKAVDIFTGFSCERFLGISADSEERFMGISADFPQNCYLGWSKMDKGKHCYSCLSPKNICKTCHCSFEAKVLKTLKDIIPEVLEHSCYLMQTVKIQESKALIFFDLGAN